MNTCATLAVRIPTPALTTFPPPPSVQIVAAILAIAGIVMMTYADGFHSHSVIGIALVVGSASMSALYKVGRGAAQPAGPLGGRRVPPLLWDEQPPPAGAWPRLQLSRAFHRGRRRQVWGKRV